MRQYPLVILDLDGTVFRGSEPIPSAAETIRELRHRGSLIRFLTNNSGMTRRAQAEKLTGMGIEASEHEVYTGANGAADYCLTHKVASVFVVGDPGLHETLSESGLRIVSADSESCDAVVVGICRTFTYLLMNQAMQFLIRGSRFLATNTDRTYPLAEGRLEPGAGSIVAAIQTCSGVSPEVIGKPEPYAVLSILAMTGMRPEDAIVVGDRVETDIECGRRAGCNTLLVLTGVTKTSPPGQKFAEDLRALII